MSIHSTSSYQIYFGDSFDSLSPSEYLALKPGTRLIEHPLFSGPAHEVAACELLFLRQIHSTQGMVVPLGAKIPDSFSYEGDFIVTNQAGLGIGIMAADCVPLVCIDIKHKAVAIAHAGWRGALAGVAIEMLKQMQYQYQTNLDDIKIFFGPSAQRCCYEVGEPFIQQVPASFCTIDQVCEQRKTSWYFDVPLYIIKQLEAYGVDQLSIDLAYNRCTICDDRFFSHRRKDTGRQMTVVVIT